MPSTKNATNRIRKSRREGLQGVTGMSGAVRRGVAKIKQSAGGSDLPAELPANGSRRASGLISKRKEAREPERASRRGESSAPRAQRTARKPAPSSRAAGKRRDVTTR